MIVPIIEMFERGLEFSGKQVGREDEREPSPSGIIAVVALLQAVHGLRAEHECVACREGDFLCEAVAGHDVDAVAQGAFETLQLGGYGHIVVGGAEV